ncbi:MAG: hypothetical protein NC206_01890 [Bacteroides sp.]|nr:hypothetical protein [Roseburia sp.]MCM1345817.1 hypothetical protein [Bacteroides sp.]MCM1421282.1 hypothetical protein [Bacteroides sp.]
MKVNIIINPSYEYLRSHLSAIICDFHRDGCGETVQNGRNLIKKVVCPDGTCLNIKRYHRPSGINLLVYSCGIRLPKCRRAYKHALMLRANGIDSPEPVAYIEERSCGFIRYSYFVSIHSDYEHKMYEWGNAEKGCYEDFAESFGRFTAGLHEKGFLHKDYSPGNILWTKRNGAYLFSLVDTNQMRIGHVGKHCGCRNFSRLWGPKQFIIHIIREYAVCRGFDADECERVMLKARGKFWRRYMKKKAEKVKFNIEL